MRLRLILASAAIASLGFGAPAFAQTAEQDLQQYVKSHPELQQNPSLMNNPTYLSHHPDLNHFLQTHPQVNRGRYGGGAWDTNHQWRDEDWWHDHDPDWVNEHHPEWNENHPGWAKEEKHKHWHHMKERVEERYEEHHHHDADDYGNPHDQPHGYGNPHDQPHGHGNPHDND